MTTTCFHHRDQETGRSCTRCGRPACSACLHEAPVGAHCWECIKAARPPASQRVRRWNATAGPVVTIGLVAVNVIVYVLTLGQPGSSTAASLTDRLSLYGPAVAAGQWYRLVSSGFVHYSLIHIAFNMLLLYQLGIMLESELGRWRFAGLYFAALLCGSFGV
ncbi:MAG TPA: rhomboid family intramembrane serine protease, partial [Acidimicrobiales bacterium]